MQLEVPAIVQIKRHRRENYSFNSTTRLQLRSITQKSREERILPSTVGEKKTGGTFTIKLLRVVVNNLAVRFVEASSQVLLGKCQPNSIGNTLTKGSCRRNR